MPRAKSSRPRPPRYVVEPDVLIYESARQAAGVKPVSPEARETYRVILGFAWVNKYKFTPPISRRQIADERGIADESTITRHINELVAAGYMTVQTSDGSASTYIPHITHQTATAQTATAAVSLSQPTAYSDTQPPADWKAEPLAHMQGVSREPLAYAPGVPINNSSSCSDLNLSLNSQQLLLHNILLGYGVFPDSAREMLVATPYDDILAWLHALVEDEGVRNVASVLVANVLRDRRQPPSGPQPGTRWAHDRERRERDWGLRSSNVAARTDPLPAPQETTAAPSSSADIWDQALGELKLQLTSATFSTWLKHTTVVSVHGGAFTISVQNQYTKDWLENRLRPMIERTLTGIVGHAAHVEFVLSAMQEQG